jgi:hypothetical protein
MTPKKNEKSHLPKGIDPPPRKGNVRTEGKTDTHSAHKRQLLQLNGHQTKLENNDMVFYMKLMSAIRLMHVACNLRASYRVVHKFVRQKFKV